MSLFSQSIWVKRGIWLLLALLVLFGLGRAFKARQARQAEAESAAAALRAPTVFSLAPTDVLTVRQGSLQQGISLSGTVRAVNAAVLKAKVAGEISQLDVREGDVVKAGQVLAHIDATEYQARVRQADEQAQAAAAQVAIAQRNLANNQALVSQGFISKTALDTSLSTLDNAQASHRAALAALDVAKKALTDTVVRSPINGQVATRTAQNGERVAVDGRILEVVDLSALEVEAAVTPADAANLRVGQTALLDVEGLPQPVAAKVARISPAAQAASRSVMTYLRLPAQPGLRHGLFAKGLVQTGTAQGLMVPATALRNDKPLPYVQWVQPGASADAPAQITHVTVKVLARGEAVGNAAGEHTPMAIIDSIADNSIILSGEAGFMQEKTAVKAPH